MPKPQPRTIKMYSRTFLRIKTAGARWLPAAEDRAAGRKCHAKLYACILLPRDRKLMRFEPSLAGADFDDDGDSEGDGGLHLFLDDWPDLRFLGFVNVEDQFVVDLEEHAGLELSVSELAVDVDHGELDHV